MIHFHLPYVGWCGERALIKIDMELKVTALSGEHLDKLLPQARLGVEATSLRLTYFSPGSVSYCLLADGEPVFAGGIVNMQWRRGEAWMLPTPFFFNNIRVCYRRIKEILPLMAVEGGFRRVQSTCAITISTTMFKFKHLGFNYEGTMRCFGPKGEDCFMYAKVFR